jgi:hypothetical protein
MAHDEVLREFDRQMELETISLREEFLERVPVLKASEVVAKMSSAVHTAQVDILQLRRERRILSIQQGGQELYPAFQFRDDGRLLPIIHELLEIFARYKARSDWDNALWFSAENDWLDGDAPIDLLTTEPRLVKDAAEQAVLPHIE